MTRGDTSEDDRHNTIINLFLKLPAEGKAEFIRYLENTYPQLSELLKEWFFAHPQATVEED